MAGTLTLLSALLLALAAVHAVRQEIDFAEMDGTPDADQGEEEEVAPDVISEACTYKGDSVAFKQLRLGSYSPEEIMQARCDEPLLVLLQRELHQMLNLDATIGTEGFRKSFPEEFMLDNKNRGLIIAAVLSSLRALSAVSEVVVHGMDAGILTVNSFVGLGLYIRQQMKEDLVHPEKHHLAIVKDGAKAITPFWHDTVLGALQDVYRTVSQIYYSARGGDPIMLRQTKVFPESNNKKTPLLVLEAGTTLLFGSLDLSRAQQSSPDVNVQMLENPRRLVANGFVFVVYDGEEGWVEEDALAPWGFVTYNGDDKLPVCWEKRSKCPDAEISGFIHKGQTVKVESFTDHWMCVGYGGFIPKITKKLTGPLSAQDALEAQAEALNELSLDNKGMKDYRVVSSFSRVWTSRPAVAGKFALGLAIAIGGILSHGLGFLIAGIVYGASISGVDATTVVKKTEQILSQVTYMELALLHFEIALVSGNSNHQRCTVGQGSPCPDGFTCLTQLVFVSREDDTTGGWCVHSPYANLQETGETCSVDTDCRSGICDLSEEDELVQKLRGTCSE